MIKKMIGNWEISSLSVPERFFEYAHSYLEASIALCKEMELKPSKRTWPNACVTIMLSAHSVELFLKGAISIRDPKRKTTGHRLMDLKTVYDDLCPEKELSWDVPFQTEYLGMSEEEAAALAKKEPVPSVQYRYPVDLNGTEWNGAEGFTPDDYRILLFELKKEFERIQNVLRIT